MRIAAMVGVVVVWGWAGAAFSQDGEDGEGGAACVPACRSSFTCVAGQCVSSCNPPCENGEQCTAEGECVLRAGWPAAEAPIAAPVSGEHRHDGLILRLTLGFGFGGVVSGVSGDEDDDEVDTSFTGGGIAGSLDVGGSNGDNLAIFGRLRFASIVDPTVRVDGRKIAEAEAAVVTQALVGAGLSYFIMPLNLYLGLAGGLVMIGASYERDGRKSDYDSEIGFGFDLEVGKEWWIARELGLGVAARASFAEVGGNDDLPEDTRLFGVHIGLLASLTYQ